MWDTFRSHLRTVHTLNVLFFDMTFQENPLTDINLSPFLSLSLSTHKAATKIQSIYSNLCTMNYTKYVSLTISLSQPNHSIFFFLMVNLNIYSSIYLSLTKEKQHQMHSKCWFICIKGSNSLFVYNLIYLIKQVNIFNHNSSKKLS